MGVSLVMRAFKCRRAGSVRLAQSPGHYEERGENSDKEAGDWGACRPSQVKSYFPVNNTKHFWNQLQGEAKRDNQGGQKGFAQCVVCDQVVVSATG